jgi:hypothetical protein
MGVIGQLPHTPDELPGRETTTGEPPWRKGPAADELPTLPGAGTQSISLTVPVPGVPSERPDEPADEGRPG